MKKINTALKPVDTTQSALPNINESGLIGNVISLEKDFNNVIESESQQYKNELLAFIDAEIEKLTNDQHLKLIK